MEESYSFYICRTPSPVNLSSRLVEDMFFEPEPLPEVVEPLPEVVEPLPEVVEPLPEVVEPKNQKNDFSKIVTLIKNKIKNGCREYHFRPVMIDGVSCYIVLYLIYKILTIESINVKCKFNNIHHIPYVLYHKRYTSISKLVKFIHSITTTYKIMNGDLLSLSNYNDMKTEEILLPYKEDEVCCVCLENTTDNTTCNHYICFKCRDKCIIQQKKDCPMCRKTNVLGIYSNNMNLINNNDYEELSDLFNRKLFNKRHILDDDSDSSSEDDEEEEYDELREVGLYSDSDSDDE